MRYWTLALLFFTSPAFAWGGLGHRAIGEIAQGNLCPSAKQTALALLGGEDFATASTWADDIREDAHYAAYKPWHFVTMPLGSKYETPGARGDLVTALQAQTARLTASTSDSAARAEALRLIIHFVGDAHQPLHAGEHDDYGGNAVQVTWFGFDTNLHHVWDGEFFYELKLTYSGLADLLIAEHKSQPAFSQLTPEDWVNESSAMAKTVYPSNPSLGSAYYAQHLPEVKQRVWLAGMRLATLLNQQLGCTNLDHAAARH